MPSQSIKQLLLSWHMKGNMSTDDDECSDGRKPIKIAVAHLFLIRVSQNYQELVQF